MGKYSELQVLDMYTQMLTWSLYIFIVSCFCFVAFIGAYLSVEWFVLYDYLTWYTVYHILFYQTGGEEINFLGMYFSGGMKLTIPIWLDLAALCIALVVGVIAGFFPARRVTVMSPLEAIRSS